MFVSFRDKRTREFAEGKWVKAFAGFERKVEMNLDQLDAAASRLDVDSPGNRLEALQGDRKGQYSIRTTINGGFTSNGRKARRGQSMLK
jgi:proteic killer suppression protein